MKSPNRGENPDKAGARIRKRGGVAGVAVRARDEIKAEWIIRIVGGQLGLAQIAEELEMLQKWE